MCESRNVIRLWVFALLFGLTIGAAYAEDGSTREMDLDPRDQPVTESLAADLAADSDVTAETELLETKVEADCSSDTSLAAELGIESPLTMSASFGWTCGPCSISACANRPVGTPCGFNRWCVVTTICSTQPFTERCVCGTHHA